MPQLLLDEWRPVVGYEGVYEVSRAGRVRRVGGKILNQTPNTNGYRRVFLSRHNRVKTSYVAHLVAEAFHGPRPDRHEVNHKDRRKDSNRASNLEYLSPKGNTLHYWGFDDAHRGDRHYKARFTEGVVREMRRLRAEGTPVKEIARRFDTCHSVVSQITTGKRWKHVA